MYTPHVPPRKNNILDDPYFAKQEELREEMLTVLREIKTLLSDNNKPEKEEPLKVASKKAVKTKKPKVKKDNEKTKDEFTCEGTLIVSSSKATLLHKKGSFTLHADGLDEELKNLHGQSVIVWGTPNEDQTIEVKELCKSE